MAKERLPETRAIRELNALRIPFVPCPYKYVERGGRTVAPPKLCRWMSTTS